MPDNGQHHKSMLMPQGLAEMAQLLVNQNAESSGSQVSLVQDSMLSPDSM